MTARFSASSSALASPVVPRATMPVDAGAEVLVTESLDRGDVDRTFGIERRDQREPRHRADRGRSSYEKGTSAASDYGRVRRLCPTRCSSSASCSSVCSRACCRACSVSAAPSSRRPAVRALGATPLEAVGLDAAVDPAVVDLREPAVHAAKDSSAGGSCCGPARSVSRRRSVGRCSRASVPGDGHVLMLATAHLVGFTAYRTAFPSAVVEVEREATLRDVWRLAIIGVGRRRCSRDCSGSAAAS